ncbi:MAG: helicase-related protein, partial [Nannocystaceae bacterium]
MKPAVTSALREWRSRAEARLGADGFRRFVAEHEQEILATLAAELNIPNREASILPRKPDDVLATRTTSREATAPTRKGAERLEVDEALHVLATEIPSFPPEAERADASTEVVQALATEPSTRDASLPPRQEAERIDANTKALQILATKKTKKNYTASELKALKSYTGWGGLPTEALEKLDLLKETPPDEYYTPPAVCAAIGRAVAPLLGELAGADGRIPALEPSAGIGRLITGIDSGTDIPIDWTAVELSPVSVQILEAIHPDADVQHMSFEQWIAANVSKMEGRLRLVVCNPPFYNRGATAKLDKDLNYYEPDSFGYFLRRGLDLLAPGGLGIFITPKDVIQAKKYLSLRRTILMRHRLCAAFRLPRNAFAAVNLNTDVLIFRARGGQLTEATPEDMAVIEGDYYTENPEHKLKFGEERSIDIPLMTPECQACEIGSPENCTNAKPANGSAVEVAIAFGHRLADLRSRITAKDPIATRLWPELTRDLEVFRNSKFLQARGGAPNPWQWKDLQRSKADGADHYIAAFTKNGSMAPWLAEPPELVGYRGKARHVGDQASWLYEINDEQPIELEALMQLHRSVGGKLDKIKMQQHLHAGGWSIASMDRFEPNDAYYSGFLVDKLQRLQLGTPSLQAQALELQDRTRPIPVEDIDLSPRSGWIPVDTLSEWASALLGRSVHLERKQGDIVRLTETTSSELDSLVSWLNFDPVFKPSEGPKIPSEEDDEFWPRGLARNRIRWQRFWIRHFQAWVGADATRRRHLADAYNHAVRGYHCRPTYPTRTLQSARWGPTIKLHPFQNASVRRLLDQRQGLLALDTGMGKTYVALAVLAAARSRGWATRPVVVVPNSLCWKWLESFQFALPDYRVAVIGARRSKRSSGAAVERLKKLRAEGAITQAQYEDGLVTSKPDTAKQRSDKWAAFEAAAYDAVIVTTKALEETRVPDEVLEEYMQQAVVARAARTLKKFEIPQGEATGPAWIADLVIVDEAARYKNLWGPNLNLKYMGTPSASRRALHMHLRGFATRRNNEHGAGVVLLSATPAKNSPVELYSLGDIIDPDLWERAGIFNADQFADRYIETAIVPTLRTDLDVTVCPAVAGFKNMSELRGLMCRFAEFKVVGDIETDLKLPTPRMHIVDVELDAQQQAKYEIHLHNLGQQLHNRCAALATLVKLSLVAVHRNLDEGYGWDNYEGVDPHSPKFDEIAKHVVAIKNCGHIVFLQNLAAHRWLAKVLVEAGVPESRIGILNSKSTSAERGRIAKAFNGDDPAVGVQYDVLIANEVAYEGLDLQTRTCAVHHGDLPWSPAELQQRVGRAIRTGAKCKVVEVYFYIAEASTDHHRLGMINGKAGWDREINKGDELLRNPVAQRFQDPLDVLLELANDETSHEILKKARKRKQA